MVLFKSFHVYIMFILQRVSSVILTLSCKFATETRGAGGATIGAATGSGATRGGCDAS